MKINKKLHRSITTICFLVSYQIITAPTHVYVRNYTALDFDVTIDYEGAVNIKDAIWQQGTATIAPFDMSDEKNMVLKINRFLPPGEHFCTIKLIHKAENFCLKQKFISKSTEQISELGISLETNCLHDPWFMNNQAKERHEHLLSIDGHTIVVIYYAYGNDKNEDVEYTLYEKFSPSITLEGQTLIYGKAFRYSLTVPVTQNPISTIIPKTLRHLAQILLSAKPFKDYPPNTLSSLRSNHQPLGSGTHEPDSFALQKIIEFVSYSHKQMSHQSLQHRANDNQIDSLYMQNIQRQEIIDYIAQKESWYSAVNSEKTTQFWIPRQRQTEPSNKQS